MLKKCFVIKFAKEIFLRLQMKLVDMKVRLLNFFLVVTRIKTQRPIWGYPFTCKEQNHHILNAADSWHCGNAWELCNWNLLSLFWACKIDLMSWASYVTPKPHVPYAAWALLAASRPTSSTHWGKNENETEPLCCTHLFWYSWDWLDSKNWSQTKQLTLAFAIIFFTFSVTSHFPRDLRNK